MSIGLLDFCLLESRIFGEGPVRLGSGVVDGRPQDGIRVNAGKHLAGTTHYQ